MCLPGYYQITQNSIVSDRAQHCIIFPAGPVQNILADLNSFHQFIDAPESGVLPSMPVSARCEVQQHTFKPETDSKELLSHDAECLSSAFSQP